MITKRSCLKSITKRQLRMKVWNYLKIYLTMMKLKQKNKLKLIRLKNKFKRMNWIFWNWNHKKSILFWLKTNQNRFLSNNKIVSIIIHFSYKKTTKISSKNTRICNNYAWNIYIYSPRIILNFKWLVTNKLSMFVSLKFKMKTIRLKLILRSLNLKRKFRNIILDKVY